MELRYYSSLSCYRVLLIISEVVPTLLAYVAFGSSQAKDGSEMILNANACSAKEDEAATSRENSHVEGTIWITKLAPAIECIACVMSRAALLARQDPELLLVVQYRVRLLLGHATDS
ncbi:hypothetical protein JG687_00016441 [Phytophthora cactorum]|uniref:Uncharacterized protein n=1 Tax=Phytophthora cactorum TaxID=29920 RepID=A0A329RVT9_9STRA|nr:hypothetical protein Pcac1_g15423 [Phytophthora cactorum]KAG2892157.1 hypothetical protein PC117_g24069 [Phytophthora cactorum]KAG3144638.1 hypothetical protein PC128_g24358 [Phytophthora cactorum]KAG4045297.1 hypothetical protein PC123_g19285 [Phytophthora cactorum]KAG6946916.1 hypothetical protein JG687_00016441 [Phytophthora cactorum]